MLRWWRSHLLLVLAPSAQSQHLHSTPTLQTATFTAPDAGRTSTVRALLQRPLVGAAMAVVKVVVVHQEVAPKATD
jgi:hypothetical protein